MKKDMGGKWTCSGATVGLLFTFFSGISSSFAAADMSKDPEPPYQVRVNGELLTLHCAHVWEPGYLPSYGGPYWFCSFDLSGAAKVEVSTTRPLDTLAVLPESQGVVATTKGTNVILEFTRPAQIALEPDGKNGPLMIFANPPESVPPDKNDPAVKYYGPGVHDAGAIELTDNQTLYLAAGAVVRGGVRAHGTNITIRGRGILDGYPYPRFKGPTRYPVLLDECRNARVEGIIIKDGWSWTFVPRGCDGVRVENVKLLCSRVENGDGFDIVNSRNITIVDCFVRTDDDNIAPKGMNAAGRQAVENLRVERCVLWTDKAHIWRIGCESRAAGMRNMVFRDIDVLHFPDLWTYDEVPFCISLEPAEELTLENLIFENIRIRTAGQNGFIDVRPKVTQWARQPVPGRVQNIIFRNISFSGPAGASPGRIRVCGPGPSHSVSNVRFENVTRNGELVNAQSAGIELLGFIDGISFSKAAADTRAATASPVASWNGVKVNPAPQHPPFALMEARRPRGVICAQGEATRDWQAAAEHLRTGLQKAIGATLPIVNNPNPGLAIILGDSPQAAAEGLTSNQLPSGTFAIKTTRTHALILGNGDGKLHAIDAFLAHFLPSTPGGIGTDLIIAPTFISGRLEDHRKLSQ